MSISFGTRQKVRQFCESEPHKRGKDAGARPGKTQRRIVRLMGTDNRILDVGCGSGYLAEFIQNAGNYVVGVELSEHNVRVTRERGVEVCQHELSEPLPFKDNSFDKGMFISVAEHLFAPAFTLCEIHRCLKPGGGCVILVPNTVVWFERVLFLFGVVRFVETKRGELRPWNHDHLRHFTLKTLKEMVTACGFQAQETFGNRTDFPGYLYRYAPFPLNKAIALGQRITQGLNFMADIYPSLCSRDLLVYAIKLTSVE